MRILFLLILVVGLGLAGTDWFSARVLGHDIGKWRIYDAATGPLPAHVDLTAGDAPVRVIVDLGTAGIDAPAGGKPVLTFTAATGGRTVMSKEMTFAGVVPRDTNIQTREKVFSGTAGTIDAVAAGSYIFSIAVAEAASVRTVDLLLRHQPAAVDPRYQPVGFALIAIGFIGLVLAFRHRGGPPNPDGQPPTPRWGRGADTA